MFRIGLVWGRESREDAGVENGLKRCSNAWIEKMFYNNMSTNVLSPFKRLLTNKQQHTFIKRLCQSKMLL